MVFLQENEIINGTHRIDYYLAQIAMWAKKAIVKSPEKVNLEEMMLKFPKLTLVLSKKQKEDKKVEIEERTQHSKQFWFSALGVTDKG